MTDFVEDVTTVSGTDFVEKVDDGGGGGGGGAVDSVFGRTGTVTAQTGDYTAAQVAAAPDSATFITQTPSSGLSGEQAMSALGTGLVKNTTGTGVQSIAVAGTDYVSPADAVLKSLYDAQTVLAAVTDNTPAAVTMAASTILARLASGDIKAATVAEILTLLGNPYVPGGTDVAVADGGTGASTTIAARASLAPDIGYQAAVIRPITGFWYAVGQNPLGTVGLGSGNNTYDAGTQWYAEFMFASAASIDRVAVCTHSAGTATVGRFSLYDDDGFGRPTGTPTDFGTKTLVSGLSELTVSQVITPGKYYHLGFAVNSLTSAANIKANMKGLAPGGRTSDPSSAANSNGAEYYTTGVTGAPPSNPSLSEFQGSSATVSKFSGPQMFVRIA